MTRHPRRSPLFPYTPLSRPPRGQGETPAAPRWSSALVSWRSFLTARRTASIAAWAVHGGAWRPATAGGNQARSEEHTSELQSRLHLVCRLLLEKKKSIHETDLQLFITPFSSMNSLFSLRSPAY